MLKVENSDIVIPNLTNATASINERNRVIVRMNDGYLMWDKSDYIIDGVYTEPESPEDMFYYKTLSLSPFRDFSLLREKTETTE